MLTGSDKNTRISTIHTVNGKRVSEHLLYYLLYDATFRMGKDEVQLLRTNFQNSILSEELTTKDLTYIAKLVAEEWQSQVGLLDLKT